MVADWLAAGYQYPVNGYNKLIFVATGSDTGVVRFVNTSTTTNYTVSNLSIQTLTVEPTKEILNVNAFDGIARNMLSGDVVTDPLYNSDFSSSVDSW